MSLKKAGQVLMIMFLFLLGSLNFRQVEAEASAYVIASEYDLSVNLTRETSKEIVCRAMGDLPENYYLVARYDIEDVTTVWRKDENVENAYHLVINFLKEGYGQMQVILRDQDGNDVDSTYIYYDVVNEEVVRIHYMDEDGSEYICDDADPEFAKIQDYDPGSYASIDTYIDGKKKSYGIKRTLRGWNTTKAADGDWYYAGSVYSGKTDVYLYPQYYTKIDLSQIECPEDDTFLGWKDDEDSLTTYGRLATYTTTEKIVTLYGVWASTLPSPTTMPVPSPSSSPSYILATPSTQPVYTPTPVSKPTYTPTQATSFYEEILQDEANPEWVEDDDEEAASTSSKKTKKKQETQFTVKGLRYKVLQNTSKKRTAALIGVAKKGQKKYDIPAKIKFKGKSYQIVSIRKNAFKGCSKTKYLYVRSKTIQKIDKGALNGLSNKCKYRIIKSRMNKYRKMILRSLK